MGVSFVLDGRVWSRAQRQQEKRPRQKAQVRISRRSVHDGLPPVHLREREFRIQAEE